MQKILALLLAITMVLGMVACGGEKPMDEWDAFVESLYDLGIEECIAIQQAAVDRYYARTA